MNIEHTDSFGNYLIHGIDEISLPDAISWWPSAPGWKILAIAIGFWLLLQAVRGMKRWWKNRYRRQALRELLQLQKEAGEQWHKVVAALPFYLKATALQAYPRRDVAALSGRAWLLFLDTHCPAVSFSGDMGEALLAVSYLPPEQWPLNEAAGKKLIDLCYRWIARHEAADV